MSSEEMEKLPRAEKSEFCAFPLERKFGLLPNASESTLNPNDRMNTHAQVASSSADDSRWVAILSGLLPWYLDYWQNGWNDCGSSSSSSETQTHLQNQMVSCL